MRNETKQTALQQLKSTIKDGIGNMNGQLNDYKSGYKQCLIDIENLIDKQLLEMEKEQIINTWSEATAPQHEIGLSDASYVIAQIKKAEQYYNETYGGGEQ
jgi:DNA replication protein DnaD